jgi:hypothetical protein
MLCEDPNYIKIESEELKRIMHEKNLEIDKTGLSIDYIDIFVGTVNYDYNLMFWMSFFYYGLLIIILIITLIVLWIISFYLNFISIPISYIR